MLFRSHVEDGLMPESLELIGVHAPRFRGDSQGGLLIGGIWALALGTFGIGGVSAAHFPVVIFPIAWTAAVWAYGIWLLRRWWILRDGVVINLTPEGFAKFPRTQKPVPLESWRSGLEINFTFFRKVWRFQILDGFKKYVDVQLPTVTDADIQSIREKLIQWQSCHVYVEKI
jgi:hypothetical protein